MFDFFRDLIGTQPILTVFLAIGVGYLVGQTALSAVLLRHQVHSVPHQEG